MSNRKRIDPQGYLQNILKHQFYNIKLKNKAYSLRAYAKKLEISHSVLSEILRGKRKVSEKMAIQILKKSEHSTHEQNKLKDLFLKEPKVVLTIKEFSVISEWQYFAILALMETGFFKDSFSLSEAHILIKQHLRISSKKTKESLNNLVKMNFLIPISEKLYQLTPYFFTTTEDVPSKIILKSHLDGLDEAKTQIKKTPALKREITSITFSGDQNQLPEAKKMIREFRDRLNKKMRGAKRDTVYKMHIMLYPLT